MSNGSGTGAIAAAPYAVTAGELVAACRVALADEAAETWADATLLGFVAEAVREYSQHLPRRGETTIVTVAGQRRYALPAEATAVVGVEYPTGMEPPAVLPRGRYKARTFAHRRAYDVVGTHDLTRPPVLLLSFEPAAGETLTVRYLCPHIMPAAADDYLTVPAEHHHVLLQYVLFAAARRQQAAEQAAPTNSSSLLMAQLASNARRLELAYLNALNRILFQRLGEGEMVAWKVTRYE